MYIPAQRDNLSLPHRLAPLVGVRVTRVACGSAGAHCLALGADGRVWSWGRGERGQLGRGPLRPACSTPQVVAGELKGKRVVHISAGRHHSVAVVAEGDAFAWGSNECGQLGTGQVRKGAPVKGLPCDCRAEPVRSQVSGCKTAACGGEFTLWLCGGDVLSAGSPEYGQLGHGTNHMTIVTGRKEVFTPQPTPRVVQALMGPTVCKIAAGTNHSLAVDEEGGAWTWGFGGYGRLGHKEQKDEMRPRRVEVLSHRLALPPEAIIGCGGQFTYATVKGGQLYFWGRMKPTGEATMYPKPVMDLSGWNVRVLAGGPMTTCVAADKSTITWGNANHQELGYGPEGRKTAARPDIVEPLEGLHVTSVAASAGNMLFVVAEKDLGSDKFKALPVETPPAEEPVYATGAGNVPGEKRKGGGFPARGRGRGRGRGGGAKRGRS